MTARSRIRLVRGWATVAIIGLAVLDDIDATRRIALAQAVKKEPAQPGDRKDKIARLMGMVADENLVEEDRPAVVEAIRELGRLRAWEAAGPLSEKLDFHLKKSGILQSGPIPAPQQAYPAVEALMQIGEPALPAIAEALARKDRTESFRNNGLHTIWQITGTSEGVRAALLQFAERETKPANAQRLWELAASIPKDEGMLQQRARSITRLLSDLRDQRAATTNSCQREEAIVQLGSLRAWEAAPALTENLDFPGRAEARDNKDPSLDDQYPAVKALKQIGALALPAIGEALASQDRSEQFRSNALYVIKEIRAGDNGLVRRFLLEAAEQQTKPDRAKRLKDLANSLPAPTDK